MTVQITDTLESFETLVAGGFDESQAKAIVQAVGSINTSHLVTKEDLRKEMTLVKEELREVESGLREDLRIVENSLRENIGQVESGLKEEISSVKIWFLGGMLAQTLALVGLILATTGKVF